MSAATDRLFEGQQRAWDTGPPSPYPRSGAERLATGLGWLSIGLGIAEIIAPETLARLIGVRPTTKTNKAVRAAAAAMLGVAALDLIVGRRLRGDARRGSSTMSKPRGIQVSRAIRIPRPPEEVYRFWRSLENLPRFMDHLTSIRELDDRHSRWKAKAPANLTVEWTAEIVTDIPNERIAWRSLPGADVPNAGAVRFTPAAGGDETEVQVELRYDPPAGALGAAVARLFGEEPHQQIEEDLRRLRQIMDAAARANPAGAPL